MTWSRTHRRLITLRKDRSGTAFVEMTIMAPLLISLALGVADFGRALVHHHILNKSMRDAGRFLARVPVDCPSGASTGSVTNGSDVTTAKNLALNGAPTGGSPKLGYWTNPASITVQVDCFDNSSGTYRGRTEIPLITVSTTVAYQDLGFLSALGLPSMTFAARNQQVHIGE
jgi:Flp pilus assembly protein TadG